MNRITVKGNTNFKCYYESRILDAMYTKDISKQKKCIEQWMNPGQQLRYCIHGSDSDFDFIEHTPEDLYDIFNVSGNVIKSSGQISTGNKIYFSNSTFPSLLLGRLDIKLKRTTKSDSADKIVSDCKITIRDCYRQPILLDLNNHVVIRCDIEYNQSKKNYVGKVNFIKNIMKSLYNYNLELYSSIYKDNYDEYQLYLKDPSKFISTTDFTKYAISQLPILQEDEANNIIYMLKSQDKPTVSTALGTLQYYNFFNYGIDILSALITTSCTDLPDNREAEYIYSLLSTSKGILRDARHYGVQRKIQFFMDSFNKFAVTPNMTVKDKVYTVMRSILFDEIGEKYKEEFERLDVTLKLIPNDENGETNVSSSEVEGEKV